MKVLDTSSFTQQKLTTVDEDAAFGFLLNRIRFYFSISARMLGGRGTPIVAPCYFKNGIGDPKIIFDFEE